LVRARRNADGCRCLIGGGRVVDDGRPSHGSGRREFLLRRRIAQSGGELAGETADQPLHEAITDLVHHGLAEGGRTTGERNSRGRLHIGPGLSVGEGHGDRRVDRPLTAAVLAPRSDHDPLIIRAALEKGGNPFVLHGQ
jgi:hypothetical protein